LPVFHLIFKERQDKTPAFLAFPEAFAGDFRLTDEHFSFMFIYSK
jgi:hypothetical protein